MSDEMNKAPAPKKRNWLRVAFVCSLALNLLIIGLVAGVALKAGPKSVRGLDRMSMGLGAYIEALPENERDAVLENVQRGPQKWRAFRKAMRGKHQALERAVTAEPFEPQAVKDALSSQREFALGATAKVHDAFAQALEGLSASERAAYIARLEVLLEERRKKRRRN